MSNESPERIIDDENNPALRKCYDAPAKHFTNGCNASWDSLLCWPPTPPNSTSVQSCFEEFRGVKYDVTQNATRFCHVNGTWDFTNYNSCNDVRLLYIDDVDIDPGIELTSLIFFCGYTLSLIALIVAIFIFSYFRDLRCLRNSIHINLMFTYLLTDFLWIVSLVIQLNVQGDVCICRQVFCLFLIIMLHYFHLTNFFWMFIEGLYLYVLVVQTFYAKNMKLRIYAYIGWGIPAIFIITWTVLKSFQNMNDPHTSIGQNFSSHLWSHCPWMSPHPLDWIYKSPALLALVTNLVFLIKIMWILITKLRSTTNAETQQYRKAAKALVVLIPLLGTTYILVIAGPTEGIYRHIFDAVRAVLLSTQGFAVAMFYCFFNNEVQTTLCHRFVVWKESRSINDGTRRFRYSSKDWSPRSRTESIRLCMQTNRRTKRESMESELTSTTVCGFNGRFSNASASPAIVHANVLNVTP